MAEDDLTIFGGLPRRGGDEDDDDRISEARRWLRMRNFQPEGPLRPRPSGKGGPSINQTPPPPPTYPVNTTPPVISGSLTVGSTLSCTTGTWTNSPTGYAYQWLRNGAAISGATSATYVTVSADGGTSVTCRVTATNASGQASALSNALAIAAAASPPVNTTAPVASGSLTIGSTLSVSNGTWTGSPTPTYTYQWKRNGTNISGATSSTYVTVTADGGTSVSCTVTATNSAGSASAASNALAIAAPALQPPANTAAPVASGALTVGSTLSCTTGTWTNSPTGYAYQWLRGGTAISGATSATYVTVTADAGTSVSCRVTATNAAGSASATSNALAIVAAAPASIWSASDAAINGATITNNGLTYSSPISGGWISTRITNSHSSGKWYIEFLAVVGNVGLLRSATDSIWGLANATWTDLVTYLGRTAYSCGMQPGYSNYVSAGFTSHYLITGALATGSVRAMAVDFDVGSIWVADNNVWQGAGDPATGANPVVSFVPATVGPLFAAMSLNRGAIGGTFTLQATAASQKYAPPSGFTPWG